MNDVDTQEHSPNDFIIQGKESFALLYNIFNRTKKSQTIQDKQLTTLTNMLELQNNILKELKAEADEGEVVRLDGTVTTTAFTILDTIKTPGHPVKAFELINDGQNTIYVGYNVAVSGEGVDLIDVTSDMNRFDEVATGESVVYKFNRNKIRNVYLLASGGNSTYRLKLTW